MAPTACSSVMEGGGQRWVSLLGVEASGARAPTQPGHSPLPLPQGSGIGSWGGLRRTLIQAQRAGPPWRRRQPVLGSSPHSESSAWSWESAIGTREGGIGYTEGLEGGFQPEREGPGKAGAGAWLWAQKSGPI